MSPAERAAATKRRAAELGFAACGVTDLSPLPHANALDRWLELDMAGTMRYMHRQAARRKQPATIVPGATTAVVVTRNYFTDDPDETPGDAGKVAKYARGADYHSALRQPLDDLAEFIRSTDAECSVAKPFVDAGPVPERELAQRAGIGWIGKNTMLISPRAGSFFFLASVLTDARLANDLPFEADRCGTCRRCLESCPTEAFPEERVLDSRLCISYLTIEHKGDVDPSLARNMDRWVFGCDVCQDVCPWNAKFAEDATHDAALALDPQLAWVDLEELESITDSEFDRHFGWTALERPALQGMRRNAAIARANAPNVEAR